MEQDSNQKATQAVKRFLSRQSDAYHNWLQTAPQAQKIAFDEQVLARLRERGIALPDSRTFWSLPESQRQDIWAWLKGNHAFDLTQCIINTWLSQNWSN